MDFTRVTTSRLALCPAHTIAMCRSCPETNIAFLRLASSCKGQSEPQLPLSSPVGCATHLTLVHHPLLGAGRAVVPLTSKGGPILSRGPPLRDAIAALHLHLAKLHAELLVFLLHSAHLRGQCLPLHIPTRLLAQAWRQQEKAAVCGDIGGDMGWDTWAWQEGSGKPEETAWEWGQSPNLIREVLGHPTCPASQLCSSNPLENPWGSKDQYTPAILQPSHGLGLSSPLCAGDLPRN